MPGEFYGCQLGSTTFEEAKQKLTARKLTIENDGQNIMLMNSTFEQFQFSASLFMFSDKGIFNSITFLQSGMTKSEAIELSHRLQATLNNPIFISAREGLHINSLQQRIISAAALPQLSDDALVVTNARHYEALTRADVALTRSIEGLQAGLSGDLVSQDIRECMHYLGEITGEITTTHILTEIFTHFCIGK